VVPGRGVEAHHRFNQGARFVVRLIQNMLFDISAIDPVSLTMTMLLLALVALGAALPPALRAASVDPMVALRVE
jgi:putative ABC transport system permease protein